MCVQSGKLTINLKKFFSIQYHTTAVVGAVVAFFERYADNLIVHLVAFCICLGATATYIISPLARRIARSHFVSFSEVPVYKAAYVTSEDGIFAHALITIHFVLFVYAAFDICALIVASKLKMSLTAAWFDFIFDWMTIGLIVDDPMRREASPYLLAKFFANAPRYIHKCRLLVCVNKRLYKDSSFHLDLTFLTSRAIAMGLPAEGLPRTLYRNPIRQVARFFHLYYPASHMIVNMCDECVYDSNFFHKVETCPTPDHEVPSLRMLSEICCKVQTFLMSTPESVVAFHCKGGKGRTGLVAGCWLLHSNFCETAEESVRLMADCRTDPALCGGVKTVTAACQLRFLRYFEDFVRRREGELPLSSRVVSLTSASLHVGDTKKLSVRSLWVRISSHHKAVSWPSLDSRANGKVMWTDSIGKGCVPGAASGFTWTLTNDHTGIDGTSKRQPVSLLSASIAESTNSAVRRSTITQLTTTDSDCSGADAPLLGHNSRDALCASADSGDTSKHQNTNQPEHPEVSVDVSSSYPVDIDDVLSVEVFETLQSTSKTSDSRLVCFAWLHSDFLEIPQITIQQCLKSSDHDIHDAPEEARYLPADDDVDDKQNCHFDNDDNDDNDDDTTCKERPRRRIHVPLVGLRDFDVSLKSHKSSIARMTLNLEFEVQKEFSGRTYR